MSSTPTNIPGLPVEVWEIIEERLGYGHFFVQPPTAIELQYCPLEQLTWEIYHGRLLDASQTRRRQVFQSWNLYWIEEKKLSDEPILSVKFDADNHCLHVTRGIECYAWEAYDDGNNVILSREVRKWARELVATLDLRAYSNLGHLREDLGFRLFQAVIGTSRLPLTSLEAPLPGFTLGKFGYFPQLPPDQTWVKESRHLLCWAWHRPWLEEVKGLELFIRATPSDRIPDLQKDFAEWWREEEMDRLDDPDKKVISLFDEIALSPYTDFVDRTLELLRGAEEAGSLSATLHIRILSIILRRLGRHLTAFDLVTFHHRGANYPDALLLDAVLKRLLALAESWPDLFEPLDSKSERERREWWLRLRGLRQGYFFRRRYEGHAVPDVPTSHGENMRVLPPDFPHLSEEEILDPHCRNRRLFADDPIEQHLTPRAREVLARSMVQLHDLAELQELGTALFLDRPLGIFKHPTEPDQTLLLSYEAFSWSVAERRLREMRESGMLDDPSLATLQERLAAFRQAVSRWVGVALEMRPAPSRPGVPSLQDAFRVAPDFLLLRTTRRTVTDFLSQFDPAPLGVRWPVDLFAADKRVLIVGGGAIKGQSPASLTIFEAPVVAFDAALRPRLEFAFDPQAGHMVHRCREYPAGGLQLVRVWEQEPRSGKMIERDVRAENIRIGPRG